MVIDGYSTLCSKLSILYILDNCIHISLCLDIHRRHEPKIIGERERAKIFMYTYTRACVLCFEEVSTK